MKTHLIRLGSVVPNGIGGPETGALDLIYTFLLQKNGQDIYRYIGINQIGDDLDEFVMKMPGNSMHVNIRYPISQNLESLNSHEKNRIRLAVLHESLLRVAEADKKLNVGKLETIRNEVLAKNFDFDIIYKTFPYKKTGLVAKVIIHPLLDRFDIFVVIEDNGISKCRLIIFSGGTDDYYFDALFSFGRWKSDNQFILTGRQKEVEIHISLNSCSVEYITKTSFNSKSSFFELMKKNTSINEQRRAYEEWINSLPPSIAAILNYEAS